MSETALPEDATILVVDDNPANLEVLHHALSESGYEVRVEVDARNALEQSQWRPPDLILLDVMLPDIDGFEICRQLKANPLTQSVPVIFMSALTDTANKVRGLDLGAVDYITKPFQQEEVLARIRLHLQLRHLSQTLEAQNLQLQQLAGELEERTQQLQQEIQERQQATEALKQLNQELEARVERRTAELYQNQEYLRQLTENIESVFWMTNLDKDRMIYVSPAYERIWGSSPEDLYRSPQKWLEAIHPEEREQVMAALPQQIRGEYEQEYRIIRPDGQIRWIRDRAFPIRDQLGKVYRIAGIAEDVTQQKQIEETLKLQERAIAASSNGVVIVDASQPDCPTIFVNPAFERITGYRAAEVIGHNCRFLQGLDSEQPGLLELRAALKTGQSCTVNLRNYRKDGSLFWNELSISPIHDERGHLTHYIGIQTDVSERLQAEHSLKQQLAAVEAAIDGIAILDAQDQYIYINQSHLHLFGYDKPSEMLGEPWRNLYYPDEIERFKQDIFPLLLRDRHWQGEATAKRRDGSTFAEEVSLTLIEGGGLVCVCRDITERKQAEEQLKSSLQEKELLLKEIHHRVKNNLLVVSSLLDWQTDYIEEPAVAKIFEESQQRIHSMALIHEKLYQSQNLAKINFGEYLETLAQQLFFSFNLDSERIVLNFELEPVFLNLETATPCGLIVSELIANVFEHAFPDNTKGQLCLSLREGTQHQIMVTIQDDGVGFPPDLDFRQTETLGLQLVCLLTQQLEGELQVLRGRGTTFQLTFSELCYRQRI